MLNMRNFIIVLVTVIICNVIVPNCIANNKPENNLQRIIYNRILRVSPSLGADWAYWLSNTILFYSGKYGVDPLLAAALFEMESGFSMYKSTPYGWELLTSRTGALGIAQLQPETATSLGVSPENPEQNVEGGIRYLAQQLRTFRYAGEWMATYAVAAYNAGPGAVQEYGGVPPYSETINHVIGVGRIYRQLIDSET